MGAVVHKYQRGNSCRLYHTRSAILVTLTVMSSFLRTIIPKLFMCYCPDWGYGQYCVRVACLLPWYDLMVSGHSVLLTAAQFESAVTWSPRGQADNPCWREWVLRQYIMRISKAMPMRDPKYARSWRERTSIIGITTDNYSFTSHLLNIATNYYYYFVRRLGFGIYESKTINWYYKTYY